MKLKLITVALALTTTPVLAAMGTTEIPTVAGQAASAESANHSVPKTPEEWLTRMTDFSRNMSAFKDPKVFVPWTNAVTEPSFYVAMMNGMMDPGGWLNMMNSAAQPNAVRNLVQFADPNILLKWAAATGDPNFYAALLTQLSDPGKLMRWAMLPVDAKLWNTMLSTLNPNTYIRWGLAGMDPRAWNLAASMANPALYTGMLGTLVNPNSYGQGTSSWLNWAPQPSLAGAGSFAMLDPVAMLGNLSGYVPGMNLSTLPTLPNIGLPGISQPSVAAPAFNSVSAPLYPQAVAVPEAKPAQPVVEPVKAVAAAVESVKVVEPTKAVAATVEPAKTVEPTKAVAAVLEPAKTVEAAVEPVKTVEPTKAVTAAVEPTKTVEAAVEPTVEAPKAVVAAVPVSVAAAVTQKQAEPMRPAKVEAVVTPPIAKQAPASSKMILAGDALFESGKSGIKNLSHEGKVRLDEVIAKIKGMGSIEQIRVVGHADPTGNANANRSLSELRAKSVRAYLVAKGIKPAVILTSGMGDTQPVVHCEKTLEKVALKACNAPNRRVEIEIMGMAK